MQEDPLIQQEDTISPEEEILTIEQFSNEELEPALILDPRQKMTWDFYVDPKSPTFNNLKRSAIRAKYSEAYSDNIYTATWFQNKLRRLNLLPRAEKVLKKALTMETRNAQGQEQADLLRIQADVAKHITKTLGKDEGYSERSEVTGKDGAPVVFMPAELMDKYALPSSNEPKEAIITSATEQ